MPQFLDHLEKCLRQSDVAATRVLAAVSGGADSTALLLGLTRVADRFGLELVAGHIDHRLRGEQARADAQWTAELCARLEIPVAIRRCDVRAFAQKSHMGIEQAARHVRHDALLQMADEHDCTYIALGQTSEDQVETSLHHMIRGTCISGLRAMQSLRSISSHVFLLRPMLGVTRSQVEAFLAEHGQMYRQDATNQDLSLTRNRIRHQLLPLLEREFNPKVRSVLIRLADQAAEIDEAFDILGNEILESVLLDQAVDVVRLDRPRLAQQPRHLIRETFVHLWRRLQWPQRSMGYNEWDRLARVCANGGTTVLPGNIHVACRGNMIVLERKNVTTPD